MIRQRRKFKPRCIPCEVEGCHRDFSSRAGLKNHLRTHRGRLAARQPQEQQHDQHDHHDRSAANSDDDTGIGGEPFDHQSGSQGHSELDRIPCESIRLHPKLNGSFHYVLTEIT